jgi:predicted PurR-regulated permease PerM
VAEDFKLIRRMSPNLKPPGENQWRIIWFAVTALAVVALLGTAAGIIWGIAKILDLLSPVLWPLAIAAVLAYLLDPAVNWLERRGISRTWGILMVFATVFLILAGVLASVIPQIVSETNKLITKIPGYTTQAQQRLSEWAERAQNAASMSPTNQSLNVNVPADTNNFAAQTNSPSATGLTTNSMAGGSSTSAVTQIHNKIMNSATDWLGKLLSTVGGWLLAQLAKATALIDFLVALILIPVYAFYFLREKKWIQAHWTNYLPIRNLCLKEEIIFILDAINQYMIAFFRGQVLVSICSGMLYTIGFLVLGLDYAFLLGFFCMMLTMIPFLGPMISCIIALGLTAMQYADWFHPLMVVVIFAVVVSLENFFYSPHIMGHRVGLHPLVIIVAVMVGVTLLGGILGGVLAIPLAAALRIILFRYLWKKSGTRWA